jgi:hypothetical protein
MISEICEQLLASFFTSFYTFLLMTATLPSLSQRLRIFYHNLLHHNGGKERVVYCNVYQTMVRGPQVVLEVCPCCPSKKTEEKIKFK